MFQTEPILALQAVEWLRGPMWLVSELGYSEFLVPLLIGILYLVDFRRGFAILQVVSWNAIATDFWKGTFALPRPDAVDSRVLVAGVEANPVPFDAMGARSFFEPLPEDVVSHYRSMGPFSYGFPSGHCSATVSTWGSIALLFRRAPVPTLAAAMILLMPVSRMYLGRHFLADTLGGILLGSVMVAIGWAVALRGFSGLPSLVGWLQRLGGRWKAGASLAFLLILPSFALALPHVESDDCARLLGVNLGWCLLARRGLPLGGGAGQERCARFLLAFFCFAAMSAILNGLTDAFATPPGSWTRSIAPFLAALGTIWGSTELSLRLGLFPGRDSA